MNGPRNATDAHSTERVASTQGVDLALHHFGGDGPPLIICHASGFHANCYRPLLHHLNGHFEVWGLDFRGHGASTKPGNEDFAWSGFADDLLAVIDHLGLETVRAFGHSMGGASILLAEKKRPGTITDAWMYEPIIFPPEIVPGNSMMAEQASKRRRTFPSKAAVLQRYASRPPLGLMRADALFNYVEYGFHDTDDGVTLACAPEHEAATFNGAGTSVNDIAGLQLRVTIACGSAPEEPNPADFAPATVDVLPNAVLHRFEGIGHFGPMQDPDRIGLAAAAFLSPP